jgi:uncharacterized protein
MTPQERQLISDLFDRVSSLERTPRDPAAERAIADAMARAPHAIYPLVQTVLLQDEALKRANIRIEELETGSKNADAPDDNRSFLESMRHDLPGREQGSPGSARQEISAREVPTAQGATAAMAPGGSFLGNAAAAAAGAIGGSLLSSGIRSLFGHGSGSVGGDKPKQSLGDSDKAQGDRADQARAGDTDHRPDADGEHSSTGQLDDDADDPDFDGDDEDGDYEDDDFDDDEEA